MDVETTDELMAEISDNWYKPSDGNLYKLIDGFNGPFGIIESQSEKVTDWQEINKAEGTTLDLIGEGRKAYRVNNDDNLYRFLIYIRMLLSRAQGTMPSLNHITQTALQTHEQIKVYKTGTRHIEITVPLSVVNNLTTERFILDNLRELVAMGIWLDKIRWTEQKDVQVYRGVGMTYSEQYYLEAI